MCLLGYGNVARALCALLARQQRVLAERHGLRVLVSAVGTRHGSLIEPDGLDPGAVLAVIGERPAPPQAALARATTGALLAALRSDIAAHGRPTRAGVASQLAAQALRPRLAWYEVVSGAWVPANFGAPGPSSVTESRLTER